MRKMWHYLFVKKDPTLFGPDGKVRPLYRVCGAIMMGQGLAMVLIAVGKLFGG